MQKEIQLTDKTLLVVSVPNEASDLTLLPKVGMADLYFRTDDKDHEDGYISVGIPQGYELLGIYPELTEEQASQVVEQYREMEYQDYGNPYEIIYYDEDTALESFQSLMEREKCYTVNPYGKEPNQYEYLMEAQHLYPKDLKQWQEAQQTTFDKYAILINSK